MSTIAKKPKVLLIGWDAADWEHINPLLEQGMLPTLESFLNQGVMGNLATLQPILSPMLWNSIATGKHAHKHGVYGFIEKDPHNGGARPYTSYSRKVRAIWNILHHEGYRCNVINWWASHPAEPINGCIVTNAMNGVKFDPSKRQIQAARGTIHPESKSNFYARFKVFPNELDAQHILPFMPKAAEVDQDNDSRLDNLAQVIAETVTTHAVGTAVMESEPWDFMAVYYTGIDHFSHAFMQYHPPRLSRIPVKDFELFKDVVVGAYRFHDMMLERLLQLAGPDTTVILCSDHGFQSREMRPMGTPREPAGPAVWHRRYGIIAAKGPGIKKDERIYGASLVDITPTILTLFGLPVGADMDGRPLVEIFDKEPEIRSIPSWEAVEGDFGGHKSETKLGADEAKELMQQFVALGYIDDPGDDKEKQADDADVEAKYNLARNLEWLGFARKAIGLMEELVAHRPWESRFIYALAAAYLSAGYVLQADKLLRATFDFTKTRNPQVRLLWARTRLALGDSETGMAVLRDFESMPKMNPGLPSKLAEIYMRERRYDDALRMFEKAIEQHAENPEAYQAMSTIYLRKGMLQECVDAALAAVGLVYRLPKAHFNLGVALARSGDSDRAIVALETAARFAPKMVNAHRMLAAIYRSMRKDEAAAKRHRELARKSLELRTATARESKPEREHHEFVLPAFASEEEREAILIKERPDPVDPRRASGKTFVLVSGLPRSGTSLMMQMLEAGGLAPKTDGERQADVDNPKGYYEWEAIKKVGSNPRLMDEEGLTGKAIKCISMLLAQMPRNHEYKIIFMTRPVSEVVASQAAMIERLKTEGAHMDPEQIERGLESHRAQIMQWMKNNARVKSLVIDYPSLIKAPDEPIRQIAEFLGSALLPNPDKMRSVIDASLYRKRGK